MKKEIQRFIFSLLLSLCCYVSIGQYTTPSLISSSKADTWVAKDALGRSVSTNETSTGFRKDKYVGIFYFIWQGAHGYDGHGSASIGEGVGAKLPGDTISPYDITKLLAANPSNPAYGPVHAWHYWGEPYFGYYLPDDEWIIRKHAQMLSDAGIDVLILDVTNAAIYLPQVTKIATTYRSMRKEGLSTPAISFIVNSNPAQTVGRLYDNIYKKELFKDLWFYWKGKPLLLCPPEGLNDTTKTFFNSRHSWAWSKDQSWFADGKDKWTWVDHTPQAYGWHESKDKPEQISVSLAEHPMSDIGRSFHDGKEPGVKKSGAGLYFAEQWKRALEVDPEFVFITGWNEWVAMRFTDGASGTFLGKQIKKGETYFVDQYNEEFSRDAEPVKGSFNDNYYYQMVSNIRKFKGTRSMSESKEKNSITIDGKFKDWKNIATVFKDDEGDIFHRNHAGWGRIESYINNSGRNDLIASKVSSDKKKVSFYVKTKNKLTPWNSPDWMNLFISVKNSSLPDWEGFQFMINHQLINANTTALMRSTGGWQWEKVADINYRYINNELELSIPKTYLGITGNTFIIDFKWADNSPVNGNPMQWLDKGDAAPNARFAYRFTQK